MKTNSTIWKLFEFWTKYMCLLQRNNLLPPSNASMELRNIILFTIAGFTLSYARYSKPRNGYDVTLNSPSSRVVKDSTPSRRRILRGINYGIGESSPDLFSNMMDLYLVQFEARLILNELAFHCFNILFI